MGLNETPSGERTHIGFFGARNAGKSSLVNAVTGQALAVVSDVRGTTTDPVRKAMELLPLGPVVIIDTPGFDDEGALGMERVKKTREILRTCDIAVLVADAAAGLGETDRQLLELIREREIPHLLVWNKTDLDGALPAPEGAAEVSSLTGEGVRELKERLANLVPEKEERALAGDLVPPGSLCVGAADPAPAAGDPRPDGPRRDPGGLPGYGTGSRAGEGRGNAGRRDHGQPGFPESQPNCA